MTGKRTWYYAENGEFIETTPICIHRAKTEKGSECHKCKVRPEVIHCCGQCPSCKHYTAPAQQLSLFD